MQIVARPMPLESFLHLFDRVDGPVEPDAVVVLFPSRNSAERFRLVTQATAHLTSIEVLAPEDKTYPPRFNAPKVLACERPFCALVSRSIWEACAIANAGASRSTLDAIFSVWRARPLGTWAYVVID